MKSNKLNYFTSTIAAVTLVGLPALSNPVTNGTPPKIDKSPVPTCLPGKCPIVTAPINPCALIKSGSPDEPCMYGQVKITFNPNYLIVGCPLLRVVYLPKDGSTAVADAVAEPLTGMKNKTKESAIVCGYSFRARAKDVNKPVNLFFAFKDLIAPKSAIPFTIPALGAIVNKDYEYYLSGF
jgi:hypothetical protein